VLPIPLTLYTHSASRCLVGFLNTITWQPELAVAVDDLRQLLHGLLGILVATVDHVDTERRRVHDVLLHEAPEAGQVRRDAWDSHHCTFRCHHQHSSTLCCMFLEIRTR